MTKKNMYLCLIMLFGLPATPSKSMQQPAAPRRAPTGASSGAASYVSWTGLRHSVKKDAECDEGYQCYVTDLADKVTTAIEVHRYLDPQRADYARNIRNMYENANFYEPNHHTDARQIISRLVEVLFEQQRKNPQNTVTLAALAELQPVFQGTSYYQDIADVLNIAHYLHIRQEPSYKDFLLPEQRTNHLLDFALHQDNPETFDTKTQQEPEDMDKPRRSKTPHRDQFYTSLAEQMRYEPETVNEQERPLYYAWAQKKQQKYAATEKARRLALEQKVAQKEHQRLSDLARLHQENSALEELVRQRRSAVQAGLPPRQDIKHQKREELRDGSNAPLAQFTHELGQSLEGSR